MDSLRQIELFNSYLIRKFGDLLPLKKDNVILLELNSRKVSEAPPLNIQVSVDKAILLSIKLERWVGPN